MDLKTPIAQKGLYGPYAKRLEKLGITTVENLLYHIPFRYDDYSILSKIEMLQVGEKVTIQGEIVDIKNQYTRSHKTIQRATVSDTTGTIEIVWFNQPYITKYLQKGTRVSLSGEISLGKKIFSMQSPDYELITENGSLIHTGRLVPIYPETYGVSSKWLRRQIYKLLYSENIEINEHLPDSIIKSNTFMNLRDAILQAHFPNNLEEARKARERLAFDELFFLQVRTLKNKEQLQKQTVGHVLNIQEFKKQIEIFLKKLPFELTNAQKKAVQEICADLEEKKPMNRLLEGDVGSGKTVVSAVAMYISFLNGYQSVLMAPTEILAQQHHKTISTLLKPLGVAVTLVTGNTPKPKKNDPKKEHFDILVGTHAVLSTGITFNKLGLVVIDEQQRFGVEQRAVIKQKGNNPHLLTMTATPIPRTVALTMYGDLDLSYLDEMPKGRKIVKTWFVPKEKRESAYAWIEKEITTTNSQTFIICPFIEESESMQTVKAATKEFEKLQKYVFPKQKLGLLHGKLKGKEKETVLEAFKQKKFSILVATPVVEVGIDIANATIIVIEGAERFGLSQLHQLRGRVGRGDKQSYCLLFSESENPKTLQRLKAMETMHVGSELAELDLKMRGPGELFGTRQHGVFELKIARFSDFALIEKAKEAASDIFPSLNKHKALSQKLSEMPEQTISAD